MAFSVVMLQMWELDHKGGWVPKNWCFQIVVLEKTLESHLENRLVNPKGNQPWIFTGRTNASSSHLMRRADSLEKTVMLGKIEAGGEGDNRGWDGWMASLTQWTWVWASSGRWWTGKPGVLPSTRSQRVRHDLATEQQQAVFYLSE